MRLDFKGKAAVITGASGGYGLRDFKKTIPKQYFSFNVRFKKS